jgi:CrcB protein
MYQLLFIFVGGGLGSLCRYFVSKSLNHLQPLLPFGTLTANLLSCFIVGFISQSLLYLPLPTQFATSLRSLVLIGFCGGFSTFSTFANENFSFLQAHQPFSALLYTVCSVVVCLVAVWLGAKVGIFMCK